MIWIRQMKLSIWRHVIMGIWNYYQAFKLNSFSKSAFVLMNSHSLTNLTNVNYVFEKFLLCSIKRMLSLSKESVVKFLAVQITIMSFLVYCSHFASVLRRSNLSSSHSPLKCFILCVNFTWLWGAQKFGQTSFWCLCEDIFGWY